jgi:hypothetical protein
MAFKKSLCHLGIPFGYLLCPVIWRSAETRFFGGVPRFWACSSTVWVVFGLGATGDSPKAGSTKEEKSVEELGEDVQAKS